MKDTFDATGFVKHDRLMQRDSIDYQGLSKILGTNALVVDDKDPSYKNYKEGIDQAYHSLRDHAVAAALPFLPDSAESVRIDSKDYMPHVAGDAVLQFALRERCEVAISEKQATHFTEPRTMNDHEFRGAMEAIDAKNDHELNRQNWALGSLVVRTAVLKPTGSEGYRFAMESYSVLIGQSHGEKVVALSAAEASYFNPLKSRDSWKPQLRVVDQLSIGRKAHVLNTRPGTHYEQTLVAADVISTTGTKYDFHANIINFLNALYLPAHRVAVNSQPAFPPLSPRR